jgi:hypothetical protein
VRFLIKDSFAAFTDSSVQFGISDESNLGCSQGEGRGYRIQ